MTIDVLRMETPLGPVVLAASDEGLHAVEFSESDRPGDWSFARAYAGRAFGRGDGARPVAERLAAYLDGDLAAIDTVRVAAAGTEFQHRVWDALRRIPAGTTTTYGALAAVLGRPGAARAVGRANALNPVAIVVPCHRVIGASGELTGYAGGLSRKRWLLRHEAERRVGNAPGGRDVPLSEGGDEGQRTVRCGRSDGSVLLRSSP